MFDLGKRRSKCGEFIDSHKILQEEIAEITGLNRDTVSDVCNVPEYKPRRNTITLLMGATRALTGKSVQ